MAVRPWLKSFQQTLAGKRSARKRPARKQTADLRIRSDLSRRVEIVEDRTLLASQVLFLAGHLQVFTDAGESVTVRENPTVAGLLDVQINGAPGPGTPALPTSSITSISIINSDGDNNVDLSGVATTNFPALTSVLIDTGNGDDTITGTADLTDTILAGDGDDVIIGGMAGNNIDGGDGNDTIMAAEGDDTVNAGDGEDQVQGNEGNDSILGDDGDDVILGGDGNDTVRAGDGSDTVSGELGADSLFGDLGNDTINGGDDNDSLFGGGQSDSIIGGLGEDFILGNSGNDIVDAGDGNDFIRGGNGNDSIAGGLGNDSLIGDNGNDTVVGNDGDDTLLGGGGNDSVLGDGTDSLSTEMGNDSLSGNSGDDTLIGGNGADMLDGGAGNDIVRSTFEIPDAEDIVAPPLPPPPPPPMPGGGTILDDAVDSGGGTDVGTFHTLTNGPGDGTVSIDIGPFGDFSGAPYDPVGPGGPASTTFDSDVYFRTGTTGARTTLRSEGFGTESTIRGLSDEANTTFTIDGGNLTVAFTQLIEPLFDAMGAMSGTLLTQTYRVTNASAAQSDFEFVRYIDGDLQFDMSIDDGGGRFVFPTGEEILFETDAGGSGSTDSTFLGITGLGGMVPTSNRFEIDDFFGFPNLDGRIAAGTALDDIITGDLDMDGFIDVGQEYDVTLGLLNTFSLAPGELGTYTTHTLFGSGAPNQAVMNAAPVTTDDSAVLTAGIVPSVTFDVVSNDSDIDGALDFSAITISTPPANGTAASLGNGLVTYTPNAGFTGVDTFQYTIADDQGLVSNPATVTINVIDLDPVGDTLLGGSGNDTVTGFSGDDFFDGGIGNDVILGLDGNDTVYGGGGNDSVDGGSGDDNLFGNGGEDTLDGGAGDDTLNWRPDKDFQVTVIGSNGGDEAIVMGNNGTNTLTVGEDSEGLLTFAQGTATLTIDTTVEIITTNAGAGDDSITVGDIDNSGLISIDLMGGSGDDTIDLSAAMTGNAIVMVDGGDGNDTITGSAGGDSLAGGVDDDSINGGAGNDTIEGNAGNDFVDSGAGDDSVDGGDGNDNIVGGLGNDTLNGNADNDTIDGAEGNDSISGGFGNDNLNGSFDDDSIEGGLGADLLLGANGNDTLDGGRDDDTLFGHSGDDKLRGDHGNDSLNGDGGDDELVGDDGNDSLVGGSGNDGLAGGDGDDFLLGDQGEDTIVGGDGNDNLVGGGGNDTLLGEQGDDSLNGNGGNDLGSTGEGDDATPNAVERIDENFALSTSMMDSLNGI